jgi:glycosyltransferase involved in cell wall biosynthesis
MKYPKVLVVGETFRFNGGGGITMINLFKDWPSQNVGVITDRIAETDPGSNYLYYQLGADELTFPFPFSLILKNAPSGPCFPHRGNGNSSIPIKRHRNFPGIKRFIFHSFNYILEITGFYTFFNKIKLSETLKEWIINFNPEIIYIQPFHHRIMRFGNLLYRKLKIPYAIHIMDDSVSFINKSIVFKKQWQNLIEIDFESLIHNASVRMCISAAMTHEYQRRYSEKFIHFRNPIEADVWIPFQKKSYDVDHDCLKIIYTGRLYPPTYDTLIDLCLTVDRLNKSKKNVILDIYTHDKNVLFYQTTGELKGVHIKPPVSQHDIPEVISEYDIFFLCLDFDIKAKKYSQYSISTRTSEGMISSVPILMYGPEVSAQYKYLCNTNSGYLVGERNTFILEDAILRLWHDNELRELLARNARMTALKDNYAPEVREKFREALSFSQLHSS